MSSDKIGMYTIAELFSVKSTSMSNLNIYMNHVYFQIYKIFINIYKYINIFLNFKILVIQRFEIFNSEGVNSSTENLFRIQMLQSIVCLSSAVKCLH